MVARRVRRDALFLCAGTDDMPPERVQTEMDDREGFLPYYP